jgi:hypothetical protein
VLGLWDGSEFTTMNKKSKFITAGSSAIILGICLIYFGNEGRYSSHSGDFNSMIFGAVFLVAGAASISIGFTNNEN